MGEDMSFECLKAEVDLLMRRLDSCPEESETLLEQLRDKLAEMRSLGLPLTEAMVRAERRCADDQREAADFENMPL